MISDKRLSGERSEFTPSGNEQGSAAVQPDGDEETKQEDGGGRKQLEEEEQRGSQHRSEPDDVQVDDVDDHANGETRGLFSVLVGDRKDR